MMTRDLISLAHRAAMIRTPDAPCLTNEARIELAGATADMPGFFCHRLIFWAAYPAICMAIGFGVAHFVDWLWWLPWAALVPASAPHAIDRMEQAIRGYDAEQKDTSP